MKTNVKISWILIGFIIIAIWSCYSNSLKNPLIWDQEVAILDNPMVKSWKTWPEIFTKNVEGRPLTGVGFYRPLETLSYLIDHTIWGFNPTGYHLTSIMLHTINAVLLFMLFEALGMTALAAGVVSYIFAIHPVNSETVTYSIRGDLFTLMFFFGTFLLFLRYSRSNYNLFFAVGSVMCFIFGIFSKETAVVIPFIIGWYCWLYRKELPYRAKKLCMVLLFLSTIYLTIKIKNVFIGSNHQVLSMIAYSSLWERCLTVPRIIVTYLRLAAIPWRLHAEYHFVETNILSSYVWLAGLGIIGFGYEIRHRVHYLPEQFKKLFYLCAGWFFIGLLPFYNVIITLHCTVLEHWLYISMPGFISAAVLTGQWIWRAGNQIIRRYMLIGFAILIAYYCGYVVYRNWQWADPVRLYQHDLACEPNSFVLHNNVGVMYYRAGDLAKAKEEFTKAVNISPQQRYDISWNNLGVISENSGDLEKAYKAYTRSLEVNNCELAYMNLSRLCLRTGKYQLARQIAAEGAEKFSFNSELNYNLSAALYYLGNYREARDSFIRLRTAIGSYRKIDQFLALIKAQENKPAN